MTTTALEPVVDAAEAAGLDAIACRDGHGPLITSVLIAADNGGMYRVYSTSEGLRVQTVEQDEHHTVLTTPSPARAVGAVLDHNAGVLA